MSIDNKNRKVIQWLRISYWAGAFLDGVSFIQMAFPRFSAKMMGAAVEVGVDFVFAMHLGASLMLAWTVLLIWADRKPLERADILLITLIIVGINIPVMINAVVDGLLPLSTIGPQIILCSLFFVLYAFMYWKAKRIRSNG